MSRRMGVVLALVQDELRRAVGMVIPRELLEALIVVVVVVSSRREARAEGHNGHSRWAQDREG
jgi:hypothetical protein